MTITIETDCGLLIDKKNRTATGFIPSAIAINSNEAAEKVASVNFFKREYSDVTDKKIVTSTLTDCMAIVAEADDQILILHVSPSQAADALNKVIPPYSHLNILKEKSEISVTVYGHPENFNSKIFEKSAKKAKCKIKLLEKKEHAFQESALSFAFILNNVGMAEIKIAELNSGMKATLTYKIDMKLKVEANKNINQAIKQKNSDQNSGKDDKKIGYWKSFFSKKPIFKEGSDNNISTEQTINSSKLEIYPLADTPEKGDKNISIKKTADDINLTLNNQNSDQENINSDSESTYPMR